MKTRLPPASDRPTDDQAAWKRRLYTIIFESKTPGGKAFDVSLLIAIGLSMIVVMLESVKSIQAQHAVLLRDWNGSSPGFSPSNTSRASFRSGARGNTPLAFTE